MPGPSWSTLVVETPEGIGDEAADEDRGSEEPAPLRDANQTDHDQADADDQPDGITGLETRTQLAISDDVPGPAVFVRASDYLTIRVTAEPSGGFHGESSFR